MHDTSNEPLALALAHHQAGRRSAAETLYRQILGQEKNNPTALYLYGCFHFEDGAIEPAIQLLRRVVALRPEIAQGQRALAEMLATQLAHVRKLLAAGEAEEARAALEAIGDPALLAAPLRAEAWFLSGRTAKAFHDFPAATAAYEQAIATAPDLAAAWLDLGNCYAETERSEDAERALGKALAIAPELKEAHASLGSVRLLAGREAEAEQSCRAALTIDPEMIAAHQNLAAICAETGRAAEAKTHRDAAYRQQSLFIEKAARPDCTVLMPTTAESGNVPWKFLFPRDRATILKWFVEYAEPDAAERLPAYDIVFNGIGDADAGEAAAAPLKQFLTGCRKPILNLPQAVARTRRDRLADLLDGVADIVVPEVRRLDPAEPAGADVPFPVLLRPCGSHGGTGVQMIHSATALAAALGPQQKSWYLTRFYPYSSADGAWRKYRVIFIEGAPFPYHLAISRHWLVHYVTADMLSDPAKAKEERTFLEDPEIAIGPAGMAALGAIGARLELDFAGIDFSILPDGRLLVFEANATMLVHPEDEPGPLSYRNAAVRRICDAFGAMLRARLAENSEGTAGRGRRGSYFSQFNQAVAPKIAGAR
ncbi:MAG: tetratricopeptide repeat protein [Acetobacteraceae bacterium]